MLKRVLNPIEGYKDRGGPAQLGTRDWAGLKGHGADRDLARYGGQRRAAPGEVKSHARRHRAPKSGTWVGYNLVEFNNGSNAIECKGMSH
jgi:hypothetical protein